MRYLSNLFRFIAASIIPLMDFEKEKATREILHSSITLLDSHMLKFQYLHSTYAPLLP